MHIETRSSFLIDWESATIKLGGQTKRLAISKGDFAIRLTAFVEAGDKTGYTALVKRAFDKTER